MELIFDFTKFAENISSLEEEKNLNEDDILVRKLLNLCSDPSGMNINDLAEFKARHFCKVYEELFKNEKENMEIVQDMSRFEYAFENIQSCPEYEDDEDVY